jgi:hypothetical protein
MRDKKKGFVTNELQYIIENLPLKKETMNKGEVYHKANVYIPMAEPIEYPKKNLPLDPYILGALLGDGSFRKSSHVFSNSEKDVLEKVNNLLNDIGYKLNKIRGLSSCDYSIKINGAELKRHEKSYLSQSLEDLGLLEHGSPEKFIPKIYLHSNIEDRLNLLKGLIDTDGYKASSYYEFSSSSEQLILDVKQLSESLGLTAKLSVKDEPTYTHKGEKRVGLTSYRLFIKTSDRFNRLHSSLKHESKYRKPQAYARRSIVDIRKTDRREHMTCISVDSKDNLFLIDNFIVTHNTRVLTERVRKLLEDGVPPSNMVVITFTNMASDELKERLADVKGIGDVFIGTLHSFANKIYKTSGYYYKILNDEIEQQAYKLVLANPSHRKLSFAKWLAFKELREKERRGKASQRDLEEFLTPAERNVLYTCKKDVYDYYNANKIINFEQLLKYATSYFEKIGGKLDYLFVDELQDIGNKEYEFIRALNAEHYFFVGDDWQNIYGWKGADVEIFKSLVNDSDFSTYYLENNYRSAKAIIKMGTQVIQQASSEIIPKVVKCKVKEEGLVTIQAKSQRAKILELLVKDKKNLKDWFLLTRTNKEAYELSEWLDGKKIDNVFIKRSDYSLAELQEAMAGNKIKILTVHSSKGLESPKVILYGNFPIVQPYYMRNYDERKVMYVGVTRAERELHIFN